ARHSRIPLPSELYLPARRNSAGIEFGARSDLAGLVEGMRRAGEAPIVAGEPPSSTNTSRPVVSPVDGKAIVGSVIDTRLEAVDEIFAATEQGFRDWSRTPAAKRAVALERLADLLQRERDALMSLLAREGGKTLPDGIAEVREAIDYCRFYAAEARRLF